MHPPALFGLGSPFLRFFFFVCEDHLCIPRAKSRFLNFLHLQDGTGRPLLSTVRSPFCWQSTFAREGAPGFTVPLSLPTMSESAAPFAKIIVKFLLDNVLQHDDLAAPLFVRNGFPFRRGTPFPLTKGHARALLVRKFSCPLPTNKT